MFARPLQAFVGSLLLAALAALPAFPQNTATLSGTAGFRSALLPTF